MNNTTQEVEPSQRDAWRTQFEFLCDALVGLDGHLFWEFSIPRMGRRVDVLLFIRETLFVLEFKVGEKSYTTSAINQVWDYALDLKNFHETSHTLPIVPILIATGAKAVHHDGFEIDQDNVYRPVRCGKGQLTDLLRMLLKRSPTSASLSGNAWMQGSYKPTPTILEAARALYSQHSVEEIARSDAGAKNLAETSDRIEALANKAHRERKKVICFVTGVPGAGKTLVGLDVANRKRHNGDHAIFLSGNGPLVAVLQEALTRDEHKRRRESGEKITKKRVAKGVKAFIQNVHHFRDEALIDQNPPSDRIAIFDEAQRAWDHRQTASFMSRKKNRPGFSYSEPEFLLEYMDRHDEWAMVVCLVGGGQEINTGEAGIDAWLDAVANKFSHWEMYISSRLTDTEYASSKVSEIKQSRQYTYFDDALHLGVSMRSFRAENLSNFVKAMLDMDLEAARGEVKSLRERYPLYVTRNLDKAKRWLRARARGSERYGLVSSSKAMRLKPHAIDIRVAANPIHWFLNDREDIRSSFYLEDVATEFQIQGLELDWVCVAWDGDLRLGQPGWKYHDFRGHRWQNIHADERKRYLKNAYRVLLTRARQGMVIFIPPGDLEDPTRLPTFYDPVYNYLREIGIPDLD